MATNAPLYDYSVVPMLAITKNFLACMSKAETFATEKGENVDDYVNLKIIEDMRPFSFQVQSISNQAKFALCRVGGADEEALKMEDNETTWAQLKDRLERTVKLLEAAKSDDFVGKENIEISLFGGKYKFTGIGYIQSFAVPNFYFHVTTGYNLLRMKGVSVGKLDFLAGAGPPAGMSN